MSCKVWDRSQTPRILMSGSREPGARERSGEGTFIFGNNAQFLPARESETQGAETDLPAEFFRARWKQERVCAPHKFLCLWTSTWTHSARVLCLQSGGRGPSSAIFLPLSISGSQGLPSELGALVLGNGPAESP